MNHPEFLIPVVLVGGAVLLLLVLLVIVGVIVVVGLVSHPDLLRNGVAVQVKLWEKYWVISCPYETIYIYIYIDSQPRFSTI